MMKKQRKSMFLFLVLILVLALAACGGGDAASGDSGGSDTAGAGDAARGKALYAQQIIGSASAPGCVTCHSLEEGVTLVGPSHAGIGSRAATAVAGQSAEDFLHESIVNPNAVVTDGFAAGVMYPNYGKDLTAQEINDLVAYLMSLK